MLGSESCKAAQQTILDFQSGIAGDSALQLALDGMIVVERGHFLSEALYQACVHVDDCNACQEWGSSLLDSLFPERVVLRERAKQYCCSHMFSAVTNPDSSVQFSFSLFRAEDPCWSINGEYAFARFCPWCGGTLPEQSFEQGAL